MDFREMFEEKERTVFALGNFLKVPAPDKNAGQLYYNEKGEGLLDTFWTLNPEPTKHVEGNKTYWINDQGDRFNVARTEDLIFTNQTRPATTKEDFQIIFNREFKESGLERNSKNLNLFTSELTEHVKKLIELHREYSEFKSRSFPLLSNAEKFIEYLNTKNPALVSAVETDSIKEVGLKYDPTLFSEEAFKFYQYLYEVYINTKEYAKPTRMMNVWFFMRYNNEPDLRIMGTKPDYVHYAKHCLDIEINNLDGSKGDKRNKDEIFLKNKLHEYTKTYLRTKNT